MDQSKWEAHNKSKWYLTKGDEHIEECPGKYSSFLYLLWFLWSIYLDNEFDCYFLALGSYYYVNWNFTEFKANYLEIFWGKI